MYKVLKIGDTDVPMLAKASTNVYYKEIFGDDPIEAQNAEALGTRIEFAQQLAFVMAKMAAAQESVNNGSAKSMRDVMQLVSRDNYLDWLDEFEFMDLQNVLGEVMDIYVAQHSGTSKSKKSQDRPSAR